MIVFERRASAILFNLLRALRDPRPFLIPANVCPIVLQTFEAAGQPFVLVDISEPSLEIDAVQCLEHIRSGGFAGLLFVRPYGSERDPSPFFVQLRSARRDLLILDDKCLCMPDCDNESPSPQAHVTLFSTGPRKSVDVGGGGFAHLDERVVYRRAKDAPDWLDPRPPDESWDEYRTQVLNEARRMAVHKNELNAIYSFTIPAPLQLPSDFQQWRFNIRVPDPDGLVAELFAHGLFAGRHYPPHGEFPVAAKLHAEIVNLFNDRYFSAEQAQRTADLVVQFNG
jgi:dTDP-4-amino-4,6-dideoxygalactose transaminase